MPSKKQLKEYTINEFSAAAKTYDEEKSYSEVKQDYNEVVDAVRSEKFDRLLDCGCGTGNFIALMAKACPQANYVGIDIVSEMVSIATSKNIPHSRFIRSDSEQIAIHEEEFDVITCIHSFHHYPNPSAFFQEAHRLLSKGGRLIIRDNAATNKIAYWWMNHVFLPLYNNRIAKAGDIHIYQEKEIEELSQKNGFVMEMFQVFKGRKMQCILRKR